MATVALSGGGQEVLEQAGAPLLRDVDLVFVGKRELTISDSVQLSKIFCGWQYLIFQVSPVCGLCVLNLPAEVLDLRLELRLLVFKLEDKREDITFQVRPSDQANNCQLSPVLS